MKTIGFSTLLSISAVLLLGVGLATPALAGAPKPVVTPPALPFQMKCTSIRAIQAGANKGMWATMRLPKINTSLSSSGAVGSVYQISGGMVSLSLSKRKSKAAPVNLPSVTVSGAVTWVGRQQTGASYNSSRSREVKSVQMSASDPRQFSLGWKKGSTFSKGLKASSGMMTLNGEVIPVACSP